MFVQTVVFTDSTPQTRPVVVPKFYDVYEGQIN